MHTSVVATQSSEPSVTLDSTYTEALFENLYNVPDVFIDAHVEGQYYVAEADADGLAVYKCNYSGATSDLQNHLTNGPHTAYAVCLDGQYF